MFNLDTIIENSSAARIIAQEHNEQNITIGDAGAILAERKADLERSIARMEGSWDAGEYGMSLAEARRQLAEADTLEAQERVLTNLRSRAIRRAQLDTSNGRVAAFFAGKPAWHGLGVTVDRAATSREAIEFAGLNWQVEKVQNSYEWAGQTRLSPDSYTIVRADTGRALGTVGSRYAPVQNADGFRFLDGVLEEFGARYESAGSLYGGSRIWILARLPQQDFAVQAGDVTESFVLFSNTHDGSGSAICYPTTKRVECANTLRIATAAAEKCMRIRHTGNVTAKVDYARNMLGLSVAAIDEYKTAAREMVRVDVNPEAYANRVLDAALEVTHAQMQMGAGSLAAVLAKTQADRDTIERRLQSQMDRRSEILADILDRYESERCRPNGSVWAAFNAVTEHADHAPANRQAKDAETRASRRFESVLEGDRDAMKQAAYAQAVELLRA